MRDWRDYVRNNLPSLPLAPERELEMVDEMAQHLEAVYEDALNRGLAETDAFEQAAAHIKDWRLLECELIRAKRPVAHAIVTRRLIAETQLGRPSIIGGIGMGSVVQDLRYGARMLLKSKAFTAVAMLSLALGIGANTALFSLIDATLLKMLPVEKPGELVLFNWLSGPRGMSRGINGTITNDPATGMRTSTSFSYLAFEKMRDNNETLSSVFAFARLYSLNVSVDGEAEIAGGQLVSGGYYDGLGVRALLGRTISDSDDHAGATPVAVITHRYWQRRFAKDPETVGKAIVVNNVPFTIIGVTPPEFFGALQIGESADISIPMAMEPQVNSGDSYRARPWTWWAQIMGRVKPGVTAEQARASFEGVFLQSAQEGWAAALARFPPAAGQTPAPRDVPMLRVGSGSQGLTESRQRYSEQLTILMVIVGVVLLIACANVANLLLARAATRHREIAVRLAVGANRFRLVRQLLTESILLAGLGGVLGAIFAYWGKDALLLLLPWGGSDLALDPKLDFRVLGFTMVVSLITGLLFGLAPAIRATRVDLTPALKENARNLIGGSRSFLTKSLIVAQVAMSLLLLVGAGLFVRSLRNLQKVDVGFNRENLLLFSVEPGLNGYKQAQMAQLYRRLTERIESVPGVRSATVSLVALLSGAAQTSNVSVQGYTPQEGEDTSTKINKVGAGFFQTMEIPILLGRGLSPSDSENSPKVAVINQTMARRYFGEDNPIGRRFGFGRDSSGQIEIVGVVRDAKYTALRREIEPTAYLPYLQNIPPNATFIVRSAGNALAIAGQVREAVREVDSNLPIFGVKTQEQQVEESLSVERLFATLSGFFGVLALLLACIGLYGVMSYGVARRTNEIGIRMALGATANRVTEMVMRETLVMVVIGVVIGLGAALATTRFIESALFGILPTDPTTIAGAVVVLAGVAAVAGYLPARRASKIDPLTALRYE